MRARRVSLRCRHWAGASLLDGGHRPARGGMVVDLSVDTHPVFLARPADRPPGVALAVKDLFDTAGLTTTYGSLIFADHVPERSADAVTRLEASGYAVVGKTNLCEFAYGITSQNAHYGTVPNPLDRSRTAGGSSSGSAAAVAAGLAQVALGTDTGGSIWIPSACCGLSASVEPWSRVAWRLLSAGAGFDHAGPSGARRRRVPTRWRRLPRAGPHVISQIWYVTIGITWTEHANEIVRERAASCCPSAARRSLQFPFPEFSAAGFMSESPTPTARCSPPTATSTTRMYA